MGPVICPSDRVSAHQELRFAILLCGAGEFHFQMANVAAMDSVKSAQAGALLNPGFLRTN